jgi:hypothetical protein
MWLCEVALMLRYTYISCLVSLVPSKSKVFKVVYSHDVVSEFFYVCQI